MLSGSGAGVAAYGPVSMPGVCTGISQLINKGYCGGKLCIFSSGMSYTMFSCKLLQIGHTDFQGIWPIYMQRWNRSRSGPEWNLSWKTTLLAIKICPLKTGGLWWQVQLHWNVGPYARGMWSSRQVVSHGSGLSRQVSLYIYIYVHIYIYMYF